MMKLIPAMTVTLLATLFTLGGCVVEPPHDHVVVRDREVVHVDVDEHDHDHHCDHDNHDDHCNH